VARYTFGDDTKAVERLALVAQAYEPVSRAFLAAHGPRRASLALDLGCGPGFSTALVDDVLSPQRLIGIDASADFLDVARTNAPSADFRVLDVTREPLPAGADVVYARLLLAHVTEPAAVVRSWCEQLAPGGVVLVEDLEDIEAPAGALRAYDEVSADVVRAGGGVMYAGRLLEPLGGTCTPVTAPAALAARIYLFNVRRWFTDPPAGTTAEALAGLEAALIAECERDTDDTVSWIVRQLVLIA